MAILFLPENRKKFSLFLLLGILLIGGISLVWLQFFQETFFPLPQSPAPPKQPEIDLTVFEQPGFLELGDPRPPIPPLREDEVGKRNLFVPIP